MLGKQTDDCKISIELLNPQIDHDFYKLLHWPPKVLSVLHFHKKGKRVHFLESSSEWILMFLSSFANPMVKAT